jgi:hypothetical protein
MKPSEIYRLPTKQIDSWYSANDDMIDSVLNLGGAYNGIDWDARDEETPFKVLRKLDLTLTHNESWVYIEVLEFDGVPFAVVNRLSTEHSGPDHEAVVTDRTTFEKARSYVIAAMHDKQDEDLFADPEAEIEWDLHGAIIARYGDEVRLAHRSDVGFVPDKPAFDREKMERDFDAKVRPIDLPRVEKGLHSQLGRELAFEILSDAILRGRKTMVGEFVHDTKWFAGFYETDDYVYEVYANSYTLGKDAAYWASTIDIGYLCHGKFYDALDKIARTREADLADPALVDLRTSFDLTDEETVQVLADVAHGRKTDFVEAAVETLWRREIAPERFAGMDHPIFEQARVLAEDPEMARFGLGGMSSVKYARDYWNRYQQTVEKREADAAAKAAEAAKAEGSVEDALTTRP